MFFGKRDVVEAEVLRWDLGGFGEMGIWKLGVAVAALLYGEGSAAGMWLRQPRQSRAVAPLSENELSFGISIWGSCHQPLNKLLAALLAI